MTLTDYELSRRRRVDAIRDDVLTLLDEALAGRMNAEQIADAVGTAETNVLRVLVPAMTARVPGRQAAALLGVARRSVERHKARHRALQAERVAA